jgi:hypothetical protein
MTAKDAKNLKYFAVLLVIAGVVFFYVYRSGTVTSSAAEVAKKPKKPGLVKVIQSAKIHVDELGSEGAEAVGQKNIFQYRQKPLPPAPIPKSIPTAAPPPIYTPPPPGPPQPPPPPPFKNFKYDGYSAPKGGKVMASLTDGTSTYQVTMGECIMGQYCVRQLTETSIEIEDLQLKQRRSFPRTPPATP